MRIALVLCAALLACGGGSSTAPLAPSDTSAPPPASPAPPDTLVLYDDGGPWGWLGEVYALSAGHLASHFGTWAALPVTAYGAGDMLDSRAVVYVGSTYDAAIPAAFLDDVLAARRPVVWIGDNVWQLAARDPAFPQSRGIEIGYFDEGSFREVRYKGRSLARSAAVTGGILECGVAPPATVLATAVRDDGATLPWAVRSGSFTYVAENPFTYVADSDRYLALADLLFDALDPGAPERHRALVRLEDVTPVTSPALLREIADLLAGEGVPFAVAVVPVYVDPLGEMSPDGQPETVRMRDAPEVSDALRYMVEKGGTLVLHGYTHQLESWRNPYSGISGDDFEFWTAHVSADDRVIYDAPVPGDSAEWAAGRVLLGLEELDAAGLPRPRIFEYPHYAGSAVDSRAIAGILPTAYHRGLYFPGLLDGAADVTRPFGQMFPFDVVDVYGWRVLPENLGNYQPVGYNGVLPRTVEDLVRGARASWVVRDGFASFFYHPEFGTEILQSIVEGVRAEGFTFVSPADI